MNAIRTLVSEKLTAISQKLKKLLKERKHRRLAVALCLLFFYLAGLLAQFLNNRYNWSPGKELYLPSLNPLKGLAMLFTPFGAQGIAGLFFFTLVGVLLYFLFKEDRGGMKYDKKRNFWYSDKGVYGTAGWMSDKEILKNFDLTPEADAGSVKEIIYGIKDGMVLSRKADSPLTEHATVMGSSGSMKSRTYARGKIISCALKGESIICTDPKGELASDTKVYLEEKGYTVKIFNLVDPQNSDRFDGLEGARDNPVFVSNIVEAVIANTGGQNGDHFFDAAEGNLLTALIFLQLERDTGEFPTLKGAYWTLLDIRSVEELSDLFDELPPGSRGLRSYNLFRMASSNVQGNVVIGLGTRLAVLQNEEIAELMSYPDMEMTTPGKEKTAYFLILSDQDDTMRFVSAMFFSLLFLRLVRYADRECPGRRLPVKVNLLLDEFCSIVGSIHAFNIKLSNVRSRGINISIIFQALGQLQNRYPYNMWSEILSNTDCILILGANDPITAKYVSERSGDVTIYADTVMKQKNVFLPDMLQPNFRHSEGTGRRKLLTVDEVERLEPEKMLVMLRGQQILEIDKFDYTRNPESGRFKPVYIKGLEEVPQVPSEPMNSPPRGNASETATAAPVHNSIPIEAPAPASAAESHGKEVVRSVTENSPQGPDGGRLPDADYAGPTIKKIGNPNI